ncbi:oligopeptide transport system permease protein [Verrucomicrobium sp. GAS474]|uniref:ABC transporter permease n=1 Tax=Verrucomicrobium sp. GAS474 TaxID=1882831 RepID=UPI00087C4566|nr:ABC transporter permease [Verrucomicrobium sp. GAS474]SDU21534.1 oligopeptide transport system permease protein [Verrucomicrobium sp. GAS474]
MSSGGGSSVSFAGFLARRLLSGALVLFVVVSLTFLAMRFAPGNPFTTERAIPEAVLHQLQARYNLAGTRGEQYFNYLGSLAHGDLGPSIRYKNRTVGEILAQSLPVSMAIGACAFVIAMTAGIALGSFAAVRHNQAGDRGAMLLSLLGISLPSFVLAPLAILLFGVGLRWFPVAGWGGPRELILPSVCLALPFAASVARLMRTSLLDVLQQDYVRTARAKGVAEGRVVYVHALKVAILPVLAYAGPLAANLMTGSLVVEQIFAIPGIGPFFVNSVLNLDIFLVGGVVLVYSFLLVLFNIVVDVLCAMLDKRIRNT